MVVGYLDFIVEFLHSSIMWLDTMYITGGVTILGLIMAVGIFSIFIGGLLIR